MKVKGTVSLRTHFWLETTKLHALTEPVTNFEGEIVQKHPTALPGSIWISADYKFFHYIDEDHNERKVDIQPMIDRGLLVIE